MVCLLPTCPACPKDNIDRPFQLPYDLVNMEVVFQNWQTNYVKILVYQTCMFVMSVLALFSITDFVRVQYRWELHRLSSHRYGLVTELLITLSDVVDLLIACLVGLVPCRGMPVRRMARLRIFFVDLCPCFIPLFAHTATTPFVSVCFCFIVLSLDPWL